MTPQARKALEYIRNAKGGVTSDHFMADHAPVGPALWQELRFPIALIQHDPAPGRDRYIVLTNAGHAACEQAPAAEAGPEALDNPSMDGSSLEPNGRVSGKAR